MARSDGLIHRKLPPDSVIHTRQPVKPTTGDEEQESKSFDALGMEHFAEQVATLARTIENRANPVDEYNSAAVSGAASSASVIVQPTYEYMPEKIESIVVTGPAAGQSATQPGLTAANPAIGSVITSLTLPPGVYTVNWTVTPQGTVGVAEKNNFALYVNGVPFTTSINPQTAGTSTSQQAVQLVLTQASNTVSVNVGQGAPTSTAQYGAVLTALSTGNLFTLQLGDRIWSLTLPPSGVMTIGYVALILGRSDPRILTPAAPGIWTLELMGIADRRFSI